VLAFSVIAVSILALAVTGFFEGQRFSDGLPALGQLAR